MLNYISKVFGLSKLSAKNLMVACFASLFTTIAILFTNIAVFLFLQEVLVTFINNTNLDINITKYILIILALLVVLLISILIKYSKVYIPVYKESALKRTDLAERLRKLPLSYFSKKDLTDITTTFMNDAAALEDVFAAFIPTLFSALVVTLLMFVAMLCYNATLALAIFWCVPIAFILFFLTVKVQRKEGLKTKIIKAKYINKLQETVENVKDIKSNNREEFHINIMLDHFKELESTLTKVEFKLGSLITSMQMIIKIGIASTVIVSSMLLLQDSISLLEFLIFLAIATRVYDPLDSALINLTALFQAFYSIKRTKEFNEIEVQEGKTEASYNGYDIEFKNVSFAYEMNDDSKIVIDDLSFTAKQGEITALVGPSGSGKSTAVKLAARFWDLKDGNIYLGGQDINEIYPEKLLENISIVFQDVVLFNNTIMENIRIGKKDASDEEVIQAAKNAMCHDFIQSLPEGYKTMIGENGSRISGGERQRLSIARALLKDAPVVFLDEATSSLDIKNETAVQQAISTLTKDKTVIIIAHRMRTIMGADKIIVLKDGKIVQEGNHEKLINQEGEYKKMVELQTNSATWKL